MSAPVRVEAAALGDPRIARLGRRLGTSRYDALGRLIHVWAHATERGVDVLSADDIDVVGDHDTLGDLLVEVDLAARVEGGLRLRGGHRLAWLARCRAAAPAGGRARAAQAARDGQGRCGTARTMPACWRGMRPSCRWRTG